MILYKNIISNIIIYIYIWLFMCIYVRIYNYIYTHIQYPWSIFGVINFSMLGHSANPARDASANPSWHLRSSSCSSTVEKWQLLSCFGKLTTCWNLMKIYENLNLKIVNNSKWLIDTDTHINYIYMRVYVVVLVEASVFISMFFYFMDTANVDISSRSPVHVLCDAHWHCHFHASCHLQRQRSQQVPRSPQ